MCGHACGAAAGWRWPCYDCSGQRPTSCLRVSARRLVSVGCVCSTARQNRSRALAQLPLDLWAPAPSSDHAPASVSTCVRRERGKLGTWWARRARRVDCRCLLPSLSRTVSTTRGAPTHPVGRAGRSSGLPPQPPAAPPLGCCPELSYLGAAPCCLAFTWPPALPTQLATRALAMPGERFHVRLLPEEGGGPGERVLAEVGLEGFNILDASGSRNLRKYPLHHISRWSMRGSSLILFTRSPVGVTGRAGAQPAAGPDALPRAAGPACADPPPLHPSAGGC